MQSNAQSSVYPLAQVLPISANNTASAPRSSSSTLYSTTTRTPLGVCPPTSSQVGNSKFRQPILVFCVLTIRQRFMILSITSTSMHLTINTRNSFQRPGFGECTETSPPRLISRWLLVGVGTRTALSAESRRTEIGQCVRA